MKQQKNLKKELPWVMYRMNEMLDNVKMANNLFIGLFWLKSPHTLSRIRTGNQACTVL